MTNEQGSIDSMSRIPQTNEIFALIYLQGDINQAETLLSKINDPLDYAMAQMIISGFYFNFQQFSKALDLLKEIEITNSDLGNDVLQACIHLQYFIYYMGFNNPVISRSECEKHFKICQELVPRISFVDDWERYLVWGLYELIQAWNADLFHNDLEQSILFHQKANEAFAKMPQIGAYISKFLHVNIGGTFLRNGHFKEAMEAFQIAYTASLKHKSIFHIWPLENLSHLLYLQGNLPRAQKFTDQWLGVARQHENNYGMAGALLRKGNLAYQEGDYTSALKYYRESVFYRQQETVPLRIFWGYFAILKLHITWFQMSKEPQQLEQAQNVLYNLKEIQIANPTDPTITNYTKYAQALVNKHGTIRTKGQALDFLEELVEIYPNNIEMILNLIELLFEELSLSVNQTTINQIDVLMEKVGNVSLRKNSQAVFSFISQQMIQAKYHYYMKGDVTLALDLLLSAKETLETYQLTHLMEEVNLEIRILENERKKWEVADFTFTERIKESEFKQYLQDALLMVNKDRTSR